MNKELKQRIINFLGNLNPQDIAESGNWSETEAEASELYRLLTRPPGRQKGTKIKKFNPGLEPLEDSYSSLHDNA